MLPLVTTWMHLEEIILSKISLTERQTHMESKQPKHRLAVPRGGEWGVQKMGEGDQKL